MATAAPAVKQEAIYYPEDRLPAPQTLALGLQHVMAMFGATVLVPLILGFDVNTVLFFSGIATLIFLAVTWGRVPSYLGSSFSFIGSVLVIQGGPATTSRSRSRASSWRARSSLCSDWWCRSPAPASCGSSCRRW